MLMQPIDPPQTPHPHPLTPQPRTSQPQPPMVYVYELPRWEYKIIVKDGDASLSADDLNVLGAQGWELAGVASTGEKMQFYFKRQRR